VKAYPKHHSARRLAKPAPSMTGSPKGLQERIKHQTKKVQIKGKRGEKGKQAEVADQQTRELPAENGETENQSAASEKEKEAKSD
jgi:high-mobility group nucleosome-binding domain-containing protein 1